MFNQTPKTIVDTGEQGNASTGDILFDGGNKINSNMEAIYNMFGDQRLYNVGSGEGTQTIHATGYYQKVDGMSFSTPAPLGTMWDADCSMGAVPVQVVTGKAGEGIVVINSIGNCSPDNPIVIRLPITDSFANKAQELIVTRPFARIECWCTGKDKSSGVPIWRYKLSSMFGATDVPVETTVTLPSGTTGATIPIAHVDEYNAIKLLVNVSDTNNTLFRLSEFLLLVEARQGVRNVHHTEYAVIRAGAGQTPTDPDNLVSIKYDVSSAGIINLVATTTKPNMRIAVKSIATQKIGSA